MSEDFHATMGLRASGSDYADQVHDTLHELGIAHGHAQDYSVNRYGDGMSDVIFPLETSDIDLEAVRARNEHLFVRIVPLSDGQQRTADTIRHANHPETRNKGRWLWW